MEIAASFRSFRASSKERRAAREEAAEKKLIVKIISRLAVMSASEDPGPFTFITKKASSPEEAQRNAERIQEQVLGGLALIDPGHTIQYDPRLTQLGCVDNGDTMVVGQWNGRLNAGPLPIAFTRAHSD